MRDSWIVNVKEFVESKIPIAKCLNDGDCHGAYIDAAIILSATISAIAASAWPGDGKDRKRFIELCVEYSEPAIEAQKISIPLLIQDLHENGKTREIEEFKKRFPNDFDFGSSKFAFGRILTGKDFDLFEGIDLFEDEVLSFSTIPSKEIRKFSYAALFYKQIRCGCMHDYMVGPKASSHPVNVPHLNEDLKCIHYYRYSDSSMKDICKIYFPYDWIEQLVISIAASFGKNPFPLAEPSTWWVDG